MTPKDLYLVGYNLACTLGWSLILARTLVALFSSLSSSLLLLSSSSSSSAAAAAAAADDEALWSSIGTLLCVVQSAALAEVVHAATRLVPSPVTTTAVQVASRLLLLWGFTARVAACRRHWSLYLMVGSWAAVEVPRYAFYVANLLATRVPAPLFWARYNLFAVLYPSGISGEVLQCVQALLVLKRGGAVGAFYAVLAVLVLYVPGSPFMYTHMMAQRVKKTRERNAPPPRAPAGLLWPAPDKSKPHERPTTEVNKGAFVAAAAAVSAAAADDVRRVKNWRFGYARQIVKHVELSAQSPENALNSARAGLAYLHSTFEFVRDGKTYKLADAMAQITASFETGVVVGSKPKPARFDYTVPYKRYPDGAAKTLRGAELLAQLDRWCEAGTIEPECRDAIADVATHPERLDLSDKYFVLLGAGSAMGPLPLLLSLGANVIAVDLDRPAIWKRLITMVRDSPARMIFPMKRPQAECKSDDELFDASGCNLFTQTPEIANWVAAVEPGKALTIGCYAYLDGALFTQVALAMDAIVESVQRRRKRDVGVAFLCTPTDCHVIPDAARDAQLANLARVPLWQRAIAALNDFIGGRQLRKNVRAKAGGLAVVDALVVAQGPNYALAKRMQHWRAMLSRADGFVASSNIAPATATLSVISNKSFEAAYRGTHLFRPMEIMYQETSNAVMCALLLYDTTNPRSVANPAGYDGTPLKNPLQLFSLGAFHGGCWRCAYTYDSTGVCAAAAFYLKEYAPGFVGVVGALGAFIGYLATHGAPHKW